MRVYLILLSSALLLGHVALAETVIQHDVQNEEIVNQHDVQVDVKTTQDEAKLTEQFAKLTPDEQSVMEQRMDAEAKVKKNRFLLQTYRPNYLLPYYYTGSPDYAVYQGDIPDNQTLKNTEFKGQLSLSMPLWENVFGSSATLHGAYTQLVYWQLYTESAWFRETNYEPEIFLSTRPRRNWLVNYGLNHQSNGRGGNEERSWNRAYIDALVSGDRWVLGARVWAVIFKEQASEIYNADIVEYMGHERLLASYKLGENTFSITARNLERIDHAAYEATWSHPLTDNLSAFQVMDKA